MSRNNHVIDHENENGNTSILPPEFEIGEGFHGIVDARKEIARRVMNDFCSPQQAKAADSALRGITEMMKVQLSGAAQMEHAQTGRQRAQVAAILGFSNGNVVGSRAAEDKSEEKSHH